MRIVVRHRSVEHLLAVDDALDDSIMLIDLLAQVAAQLGRAEDEIPHQVFVDDRLTPVGASIADASVVDGSIVSLDPPEDSDRPAPTQASIDVTGGLASGGRIAVGARRLVVGRSTDADVVVSASTADPYHLAFDPGRDGLVVTDLDTVNGTVVNADWLLEPTSVGAGALIDVGAAQLTVRSPDDDRPDELLTLRGRTAAGTLPFNRPPRHHGEPPVTTIAVPAEPSSATLGSFFSWAGLLAPLAMGGLMAWLYNPLWALFALLGPVMMVGSWLESRRRNSKASRRSRIDMNQALERLGGELAGNSRIELRRRRDRHPDLAELVRRVDQPSTRLWQRRLHHDDAMHMVVGTADLEWQLDPTSDGRPEARALELLDTHGHLDDAPLVASLRSGQVMGLAGDRAATVAVARSLVLQASIHHGPADLEVAVLASDRSSDDWGWIDWLPHSRSRVSRGRDRAVAIGDQAIFELVAGLAAMAPDPDDPLRSDGPMLLVVVDGDGLTTGRAAPARAVLGGAAGPAAGIVIASSRDRLPHFCTTVVEVTDPDGLGRVAFPQTAVVHDGVLLSGTTPEIAADAARRLARFADPEVDLTEASIPSSVSLLELLSLPVVEPSSILARWANTAGTADLLAPIGADGLGPLVIDLVKDGPHALVGGTTGSGKSELLRTLVASLAAGHDTQHLNFVLIDYKGGSAFDTCARLPHTVGLVTDLDEHLGARALTCLEAELQHREHVLRHAGVTDIGEYRAIPRARHDAEHLPRLVVVIDEFATMAAELPDFLDALVGIAQRGRSLGVHLVLATQRPSGAVSPSIRTNTSLRIALRVLDAADSADVIDTAEAASIGRDQPGRAYIRLGPTEVVGFQTAMVTGHTSVADHQTVRLVVGDNRATTDVGPSPRVAGTEASDLDRLVAAIRTTHANLGHGSPRRPWPDPLPSAISLDELPTIATDPEGRRVTIGLADDPRGQCQSTAHWDLDAGNIALVGTSGAGTTTALTAIAIALSTTWSPDQLHIYAIDQGAGGLRDLQSLPHVGSVIDAAGHDRQLRLVRRLDAERRRRSTLTAAARAEEPRLVVLIDGYGSWRDDLDSAHDSAMVDAFARTYADGPPLGIHCAIAGDHVGAISRQLAAVTSQLFLFRLADAADYLTAGLRVTAPEAMPAGRAFRADSGQEVQFAIPHAEGLRHAIAHALTEHDSVRVEAPAVGELPTELSITELSVTADFGDVAAWIPVGIGDDELAPVGFELYGGEHALIAGRARTGKTTSLCAIAQVLSSVGVRVIGLAPPRSSLLATSTLSLATTEVGEAVSAVARRGTTPTALLVDDADTIDDVNGTLEALLVASPGDDDAPFHAVLAGRTDRLLGSYGHWSAPVRSSRNGVLLCPELLDGDLFSLQLPPRTELPALPGRGWFVAAGSRQVCQLATPPLDPPPHPPKLEEFLPHGGRNSSNFGNGGGSGEADQRSRRTRSA